MAWDNNLALNLLPYLLDVGAEPPTGTGTSAANPATGSLLLQNTSDTANLIQSAFQHNHWAAVPLLVMAGAPWPQSFQPLSWRPAQSPNTPLLRRLEVSNDCSIYTDYPVLFAGDGVNPQASVGCG
jgi:hypothetical protein